MKWSKEKWREQILIGILILFGFGLGTVAGTLRKDCPDLSVTEEPRVEHSGYVLNENGMSVHWYCLQKPLNLQEKSVEWLIACGLSEWANCYAGTSEIPKEFGMFMVRLGDELEERGIDVSFPEDYMKEAQKIKKKD